MTTRRRLAALRSDRDGATMIEFGLLAPIMLVMLLGVLGLGIQMQNYNALHGIGYDVNRYTVIEYQKDNKVTESGIEQMAISIARRSPYSLSGDRFDVDATDVTDESEADGGLPSGVTGVKKFRVELEYTPARVVKLFNIRPPTIRQVETIIVPD